MTKKSLQTAIYLAWTFLIGFSIIKLFFTDAFVLVVSNAKIIAVGGWIDEHTLVNQILLFGTSYFIYFFYLCACIQKWNLTLKQHIVLILVDLTLCISRFLNPQIGLVLDTVAMIILPCVFKAKYTQFTTVFVAHYAGQLLLLLIRSKPLLLLGVDFATQFILAMDTYLWIVIYYLYSNKYKEETLWEELAHRFSGICQKLRFKKKS